ncbi:MAG: hypothetical protein ACF8PN_08040 [Phycisphaerales bacterium]
MTLLHIGIDPGATGAIAAVTDTGELVDVDDMPVVDGHVQPALLAQTLKNWANWHAPIVQVAVEKVGAMPKQGVSSTYKFGEATGVALGVVGALNLAVCRPLPSVWKRNLGVPAGADKDATRRLIVERFPQSAEWFARKKDHGRADAVGLALHSLNLRGER